MGCSLAPAAAIKELNASPLQGGEHLERVEVREPISRSNDSMRRMVPMATRARDIILWERSRAIKFSDPGSGYRANMGACGSFTA